MRLAVLSDPHGNLPALEAVLTEVDRSSPDAIWVAGDLVGYNPWPNEVLGILKDRHVRAIRGNHDRAAVTGNTSGFNDLAAKAVKWTRIALTPESVGYLKGLEDHARLDLSDGAIAMYHGSPREDDEYIWPWMATEDLILVARARILILGHTHVPMAFAFRSGFLANPGSVGQPRDHDPRASWALLDTEPPTFEIHRVRYDVEAVAAAIRKAGLPPELADRLKYGV
jgi:putative phosphoesterase